MPNDNFMKKSKIKECAFTIRFFSFLTNIVMQKSDLIENKLPAERKPGLTLEYLFNLSNAARPINIKQEIHSHKFTFSKIFLKLKKGEVCLHYSNILSGINMWNIRSK